MHFNFLFEKLITDVHELFSTFVTKRAAGAKKIEEGARKKGKYSILTAYHFAGKVKPYAKALKLAKSEDKDKVMLESYKEVYSKLKNVKELSQKEFQTLTGELEVWGEVFLQSRDEKDYSK